MRIELVKVDAQGVDLEVAMSAGDQLQRVENFVLELQRVPTGDPRLLYVGQRTSSDAVLWMGEHGFTHDQTYSFVENAAVAEANELFVRK